MVKVTIDDAATPPAQQTAQEQKALWNGAAGNAWVQSQATLDHLFKAFEEQLVEAVFAASAQRVLDIGCGTGVTTLAIARLLGERGQCTGIDLSQPMIDLAKERATKESSPASFICADAQDYAFKPASYDMITSRFGVMFFSDNHRAFSHLRHALINRGQLHVIAWRSPDDNPFMTTAHRIAAPLIPELPQPQPHAPGQFAFADRQRVTEILSSSGWQDIDIQPIDVSCVFSAMALDRYIRSMGPVGAMLQQMDEARRQPIVDALHVGFEPYVFGEEVRFNAACWTIRARA